jgi:hypothetical protein
MTEPQTGPTAAGPAPGLGIDEVLPAFDVNLVQHIVVNADPRATYDALLRTDLNANPVTRLLVRVRDMPNVLGRRRGADKEPASRRFTIGDLVGADTGWVGLRAEPGVELLAGLVGQFWHRDYGVIRLPPEEFADFDRPGYAKTVADFSLRPFGQGRTLLTYESRTATTDAQARRRFAAYWVVLRPFVRQLMRGALIAVKREAEGSRTRRPLSSFAPRGK